MPGKVKVKIVAGRNLPVMDRSSDTTDAYVEIKLGNTTFKTDVCRKSLNPQWNSEWYRFEVDDSELQDEPLQLRLMDHDTYSANDAIGKVYLDLNPLLLPIPPPNAKSVWTEGSSSTAASSGSVMSGWIPVYDTMHGIRGEVHVIVKVELFSDFNRFRQSSCGVLFFCSSAIPQGYHAQVIHGFVEELIVNDDPEYQWIDKIRTPRASNEARQTLFFKLSGEVQRKIGLKALDLGGNAVIGYHQCFDLEGESGIVARGIGTAVSLVRLHEAAPLNASSNDELQLLSPFTPAPCLYGAPSSPRLCVIPPTPTSCVNPLSSVLTQKFFKDENLLPLMGPHFPKPKSKKKGRRRQVVVIPASDNQKPFTHRRQCSAPFDLGHHTPYKRQNSTKSLVTDLSDLRHLLEQEDMRHSPGSPGSSRFMKAIRHLPRKVNALRGKLQSDDSDFDTISCSSTRSLSLDLKKRTQKRNSNDSVTAALIRSIMIDSGRDLVDRGGLSRVVEGEETALTAPATPKLNLYSSNSEIELGGAKELIHQISSDLEESIAFVESSNASSSCDTSISGDDVTDSSILGLKDEENSLAYDFDLQEGKDGDNLSVSTSENAISDIQLSPGKGSKGRVTFVIGCNEVLQSQGGRKKSRSLSPKKREANFEIFQKKGSLSPILVKRSKQSKKILDDSTSSHRHSLQKISSNLNSNLMGNSNSEVVKSQRIRGSSSSPKVCKGLNQLNLFMPKPSKSSNPFDKEFNAAAKALKTTVGDINVDDLPQPFELSKPGTPPNSLSSLSDSSSPLIPNLASSSGNLSANASALESNCSSSACIDLTTEVDHNVFENMKAKNMNQYLPSDINLTSNSPNVPYLFDMSKVQDVSTNVAITNLEDNLAPQPKELKLQSNFSMDSSSEISNVEMALKKSVSDNLVCSLTLDTPRVLSQLHKSRSTTSLVCRHEAAAASHFANDGEREGTPSLTHDEDRAASHGLPSHLSAVMHKHSQSPAKLSAAPAIHRRSSDSDLSVTPKGNSLTGSDRSSGAGGHHLRPPVMLLQPPIMSQDNFEMLEYPFLTVSKFPPGFIQSIGGTVSSRSVKLLERITNLEEPETRDTWWKELRMEVRSHARALGCNVVLGYAEHTSICDDVCVLSAAGTAAVISLQCSSSDLDTSGGGANTAVNAASNAGATDKQVSHQQAHADQSILEQITQPFGEQQQQQQNQGSFQQPSPQQLHHQQTPQSAQLQKQSCITKQTHDRVTMTTSLDRTEFEKDRGSGNKGEASFFSKSRHLSEGAEGELLPACFMCHIPYSESSVPFRVKMMKCAMCKNGKVPDVLLSTMEPPERIPVTGRGCLVQAYVCRPKRDTKGELNAKEISDGLPFLEYELHRMLLNKLKVKGMNAIFGLKVQVSIGERMLVGLATGTAMFLSPLPSPPVPTITAGNSWSDERRLLEVQKTLAETVKRNREIYQLKPLVEGDVPTNGRCNQSDTEDSEDDLPDLDLAVGNKDTCVMEVDDNEDVDVISLLMDPHPPEGFFVVNTEVVPGLEEMEVVRNLQMFTQVWRAKVTPSMPPMIFSKHFHRMLQSVYFKLRHMVPCALAQLQFFVELPESDELQLSLLGMALGLGESDKKSRRRAVPPSSSKEHLKKEDNDLIFSLEEDVVLEDTTGAAAAAAAASAGNRLRPKSPHNFLSHSQRFQNLPKLRHTPPRERYGVDITPLSYVPGGKIERYLGNLNFFFIRESTAIRESGGLSGFVHSFIAEVLAIVRAHVTALGGNAMVAYFISENVLLHNPHKNQGQCLINVGGDVVQVSYYSNEQ